MTASHHHFISKPFLSSLQRGFLPAEDPLERLPAAAHAEFDFNHWLSSLAENLPAHLQNKSLREAIDSLNKQFEDKSVPLIAINKLDHREVNHAMLILTLLVQAYVWQDTMHPVNVIPRILAENINELLRYNPRVPVLTYSDYVLNNWRLLDKEQGITLDNVEPLFVFTASAEEAWFIKIHVVIEAAFAKAIEAAYKIHGLMQMSEEIVNKSQLRHRYFTEMAESIEQATAVLSRMYDHCSPSFFFSVLRPYLEGMDKAGGVAFDSGVSQGGLQRVSYRGSSGAQSSVVPALDAILGVRHADDNMTRSLQAFLAYMPARHRAFIQAMQAVNVPDSEARRRAMMALWQFRKSHQKMPVEYIAHEAVNNSVSLEKAAMGTGSTEFGFFLGKRARHTLELAMQQGGVPLAKM